MENAILTAIKNNAAEYLNPPIMNISYKGILKTSIEIIKWFNTSKDIEGEFKQTALLMKKAETGGALFRNLYRDFLKESYEILQLNQIKKGYKELTEIAELWTVVSQLFEKVSETKDIQYILQSSDILKTIAAKEKRAMKVLSTL
ncbi:DUF4872 domain-containing protein [Chryseobacterium viscerum]|uniref:DUF4872 domain-containing protein n=1 Tax=Chryseobacterium viscerum TaxID=1037377 RepID=UPI002222E9AE|nr:DUF4872 domain-containing protein [Chryseobacterium viscerum]MCW1962255.1 DUF4872 domain-containing protein [Chryseobacterium viscerum]